MSDNISLPPLSIASAEQHQQHQTYFRGNESIPPIESDRETESILFKQYNRLQNTLHDSFDEKRKLIEIEASQTNIMLNRCLEEKEELGVSLYQSRKTVNLLNRNIAKTKTLLQREINEKQVVIAEFETGEKEIEAALRNNENLKKEMEVMRRQVEEGLIKIKQLQEINGNYTSDIKIQKRIHHKLEKEVEVHESNIRALRKDLEDERQKCIHLISQKKEVDDLLEAQKNETAVALNAIQKMHKENNQLEVLKSSTEKQWEEAITAMSKRDKVFQTAENNQRELQGNYAAMEQEMKLLKEERNQLAQSLSNREQECESLNRKLSTLQQSYQTSLEKTEDAKNSLLQANHTENTYKNELNEMKKGFENATSELNSKSLDIRSLKTQLNNLKEHYELRLKTCIPLENAFRREEKIKEDAEIEIMSIERDEESKNLTLRRQITILKNQLESKDSKLTQITSEQKNLREQFNEISGHYNKLYEEAKHLIYALERKEHDLNFLKAKINEEQADHTGAINLVFGNLQTELKESKKEVDRLQQLWLQSQKESLKAKDKIAELEEQNSILNTRIGISDVVKAKSDKGLAEIKSEAFGQKMEVAKLHNQLKKMEPLMAELQLKNNKLEQQLMESKLKLEEAHVNSTTSTQMLRCEIRRLMTDRSELRQQRAEKERSTMDIERKTQVYQEIIDKLKSERYELQRQNYLIKRRADELDRKLYDSKIKARKTQDKTFLKSKLSKGRPKSAADTASLYNSSVVHSESIREPDPSLNPYQTNTDTESSANNTSVREYNTRRIKEAPGEPTFLMMVDFDTWRLRLDSLVSEKEFLVNENNMLKRKMEELTRKLALVQDHLANTQEEVAASSDTQRELTERMKVMDSRLNRASKVAAYMEKQIKDAKPNAKIDYHILQDVEPSTQLLAALLARNVQGNEKSAPGSNPITSVQ